jgi:hypothetical protein
MNEANNQEDYDSSGNEDCRKKKKDSALAPSGIPWLHRAILVRRVIRGCHENVMRSRQ